MKTVEQRTHGAASAFGKTLPGQMDIARAHIENLGTHFGLLEEKGIQIVERGLASVIGWFSKNSWAAKALAGVIGVVLGGAVATFVITKVAQFIGGAQKMGASFAQMVGKFVAGSAETVTANTATADSMIPVRVGMEETATTAKTTGPETEAAFGPIGIAIALLGAAFFLFHKHFKAIWKDIRDVAVYAWHFLDNIFHNEIARDIMYVVMPLTLLLTHWRMVWSAIRAVARGVALPRQRRDRSHSTRLQRRDRRRPEYRQDGVGQGVGRSKGTAKAVGGSPTATCSTRSSTCSSP